MSKVKLYDRIGEVFTLKSGHTLTIIGVSDEKIGRCTKHLVECSHCSLDKELFPEPFKILYNRLVKGGSPCACSMFKGYTEEQVTLLVKRRCTELGHEFVGFDGGYCGVRKSKLSLKCSHGTFSGYTVDNYLNKIKHGCAKCAADVTHRLHLEDLPTNVSKVRVEYENEVKTHYYQCSSCSSDWFVLNNYCNGWFKFTPNRLQKGKLSCRCSSSRYRGDDLYKKGRATLAQINNRHITVLDYSNETLTVECAHHGKTTQNYESCCDGRPPRCCTSVGWYTIKNRVKEIDNLYVIHLHDQGEDYIKIGRSFDIRRREGELSKYYTPNLLGFIQAPHDVIVVYEKFFHKIFGKYRVQPCQPFGGDGEVFSTRILKDEDFKLLVDKFIFDY